MQKVLNPKTPILGDTPFEATGVSLYVTAGAAVQYRRARVLPRKRPIRGGDRANYVHWPKTLRRDFVASPGDEFNFTLPAELLSTTISVDVRRCEAGIENESAGFRTITFGVDGDGDGVPAISGRAIALAPVAIAGGVVRIRFMWIAGLSGVVPTQFRVVRTSGPTSPADIVQVYEAGILVEIETAALDDVSPYQFSIVAENDTVTATVLMGYQVQADASGPPEVASVTSREW